MAAHTLQPTALLLPSAVNLDAITPLILAYNEAPNIGRCLERLRWARRIVVVDSFSDDETLAICAKFPQVEIVQRAFDSAAAQDNFGLSQVRSEWTLSLDSDYILTSELKDELEAMDEPPSNISGYRIRFTYCVFGKPLRGTLYPPRLSLYRTKRAQYADDGHTQRVRVDGRIEELRSPICHDDQKPLVRWFKSQRRYAELEAEKLYRATPSALTSADRLRRRLLGAPAVLFWCLVMRGLAFEGRAGWYYTVQRTIAELMLTACLLDRALRDKP